MLYTVLHWAFVYFYSFDIRYTVCDLSAFDCILVLSSSNLLMFKPLPLCYKSA